MAVNIVAQLGDLPAAQQGYFTRAQAAAASVPDFDLTRSVQRGFIERVGHGVYRVAGAGHDPLASLRIAWLRLAPAKSPRERATNPQIWVAYQSAAHIHGFGVFVPDTHTFIATRRLQTGKGTIVHRRSKGLARSDWEVKEGFALTTVGRTATDLFAANIDGGHIGRFLSEALQAGATTTDELVERTGLSSDRIESLVVQGDPVPTGLAHG